jgi:hypothetical protein
VAGSEPQPRGRAAVVVVHGIGAQPPLATLSSLAQGLIDRARGRGERLQPSPALVRIAGVPRPVVRFEDGADLGGFATVDLYEFAWQGLVQGRATPRAVLLWLLRTGLAPLHVRRHWRVLSDAGANAPAAWAVVAWQSLFTALLLLVVLALTLGLVVALLQLPRGWPVISQVLPAAAAALGPFGALVLAAGVVPGAVALASVAGVVGDALEAASLRRA